MATRVRTLRHARRAPTPWRAARPNLFSLEMWGGATFDTAMRFLNEDPWERLRQLRERVPNICFQMLFRGSNAVGYTNYPGQRRRRFREARRRERHGYLPHLRFAELPAEPASVAMEAVQDTHAHLRSGASATPATSSIRSATKYSLKYYVELAKELEKMGAHFLAIKDMAGPVPPVRRAARWSRR